MQECQACSNHIDNLIELEAKLVVKGAENTLLMARIDELLDDLNVKNLIISGLSEHEHDGSGQ
jgi:hypothetical protein